MGRIASSLPPRFDPLLSWKKIEFEDLNDLLVSFGFYFVIVEVSLCISTMYYLLLRIYVVLIVKKEVQNTPNIITITSKILDHYYRGSRRHAAIAASYRIGLTLTACLRARIPKD
jgi:hypothetical protein